MSKSDKEVTVVTRFTVASPQLKDKKVTVTGFHFAWAYAQTLRRPVTVTLVDWVRIDKDKKK